MNRNQRGFTLMELMVVIVIVAILAAVAVPLYINYVRDALRSEAKAAIGAIVTAEQTYFQLNPDGGEQAYVDVAADGFVQNPTSSTQVLNCDLTEALNNWSFLVNNSSADGFTVVAQGKDGKPTAGLYVSYTFSRTNPPAQPWSEAAPSGP
jgi:prepilin-type N-terminal cleavage/methylation domain-containing protein